MYSLAAFILFLTLEYFYSLWVTSADSSNLLHTTLMIAQVSPDINLQCGELTHVCKGRIGEGADFIIAQVSVKSKRSQTISNGHIPYLYLPVYVWDTVK